MAIDQKIGKSGRDYPATKTIKKTYTLYLTNPKFIHIADGTIITWRITSRSDDTPVVEINIKRSSHTGGLKAQKIHFVED